MSKGRLIGVVGPSGVGKDSVMAALAELREDITLIRRVITRDPAAGGETFEPVSKAEFERRVQAGDFALHWRAHGLRYGVPAVIERDLDAGRLCLVNLSRGVLAEAQALFDGFTVLNLTAPQEVLAARLVARGRESTKVIKNRLDRASFALPEGLRRVVHMANTGPLNETASRVLAALHLERSAR